LQLGGAALEVGGRILEGFVGEFGIRDVLHNPHDTDRLAPVIDDDRPLAAERADPAVGVDRAHFEREWGSVCDRPFEGSRTSSRSSR
jgi:hypothetical protein